MSILQADLEGARVLDLFAGSGALGLEALSRGAASSEFVELGAASVKALKSNIESLAVADVTEQPHSAGPSDEGPDSGV
jgi:16S rRNA (guanine966-N2)-methyltransferase